MLFEPAPSRKKIQAQLLFFLIWVFVTAVGLYLTPSVRGHGTHTQLGLPPCGSVIMFDRPCPGCGMTTSFTATLHGRISEALQAHPLGPLSYIGFTIFAWLAFYGWLRTKRFLISEPVPNRALLIFAILFLGYGTVRFFTTPNYSRPEDIKALQNVFQRR
jgi:hypothetical protein